MKPLLFLVTMLCAHGISAQIKLTNIDKNELPKSIHYKGKVGQAVRYTDKQGDHLIITSEDAATKKFKGGQDDEKSMDVYACSYILTNGQWTAGWQMHDLVSECQFDADGGFIKNTFAVTDLNKDGEAEVWLTYYLACRSDVSPSSMKIIMHEGEKKFALRGHTKVKVSATDYYGGDYKFDEAFNAGPDAFKQYALRLWKKNILEAFQ